MRMIPAVLLLLACSETGVSAFTDPAVPPEGEAPVPAIQVEPTDITFEPLEFGDRAIDVFTVTNVGDALLEVLDVSFQEGPSTFSFQALDGTELEPGASAEWSVSYRPDSLSTEPEHAKIAVVSNDPERIQSTVTLTGTTLLPAFELSPVRHDFGVVDVGNTAATDFVLRNSGEADGLVTGLSFTASSDELAVGDPGLAASVPLRVKPGESITVPIAYAPLDDLRDEGTLELLTNAPATPSLVALVEGTGFATDRDVEIFLTADDAWTGFIDGAEITGANQSTWTKGDTIAVTLPAGEHVIAIRATDVGSVISGFIAVVKVDGTIVSRTGEGDWLMTATEPATGWQDVGFDDSGWSTAVKCSNPSTWGTYWPKPFYDEGAEWVWWTASCRDLKQAWFRMKLDL